MIDLVLVLGIEKSNTASRTRTISKRAESASRNAHFVPKFFLFDQTGRSASSGPPPAENLKPKTDWACSACMSLFIQQWRKL
jgi:hypothetical protein